MAETIGGRFHQPQGGDSYRASAGNIPASAYEDDICQRCNCCSVGYEDCGGCGGSGGDWEANDEGLLDGYIYRHCEFCSGAGAFPVCIGRCNDEGKHEKKPAPGPNGAR